jgi:hypothetical protein
MKDFLLIFRNDIPTKENQPSPEQLQATTKLWMDWIGGIAAQNKLANQGNRLMASGKVLKPNQVITDGPYTEIKEAIGGYSIVKAETLEEAVELAKGCPGLIFNGSVEVREINAM